MDQNCYKYIKKAVVISLGLRRTDQSDQGPEVRPQSEEEGFVRFLTTPATKSPTPEGRKFTELFFNKLILEKRGPHPTYYHNRVILTSI